jgi:hypothetical protein
VTTKEIADRVLARADDDAASPGSVVPDPNSPVPEEVLAAIDEGQQLASWMTLCLEVSAPITLTANGTFYALRSAFPDFLAPLRLTTAAGRIRPATFADLDALNPGWQARPLVAGEQMRYATLGFSFFATSPQPVDDTPATLTYARSPAPLVGDAFLEIPEAYHLDLVDYGLYRLKLKEGAQSLERAMKHLNRFLDRMQILGDFVRARSRASRYDTLPFELSVADRSRLMPQAPRR